MKYDAAIRDFRSYLQQTGYSKSSFRMLPACVSDFLSYHEIEEVKEAEPEHILQFYQWLKERPHKRKEGALSEMYIHHHIYALKLFFSWLEERGEIRTNPISMLKFKAPESIKREPLTREETEALFRSCESLEETAILHLFYSCGLRRSEGEALDIRDIHFKQQVLYVRKGKGAKRRAIPMTEKVSKELESYYLEERSRPNIKDHEAFMLNRTGTRMSGDSYNKRLQMIVKRTEIKKPVSLHYLRHSIATHLLESGLPVEYVRDFLGHSYLESTQVYTKVRQYQLKNLC